MTNIHTCSYSCERPECIRAQRDELAGRLATHATDPVRALLEKLALHVRPTCTELYDEIQAALAQQPEAKAQQAFGHVYRIVSPQIPATRDGPWIGPGVNFEFGPPPADTPCVQYLALYAAPQPAIPEGWVPEEEVHIPDPRDNDYAQGRGLGYVEGWNACRARVLAATQTQEPDHG